MKKNDINNALNRELKSVRLSDQMKRDILYNAQHAERRVAKKQIAYAAWAAAAMVVILGASLLISGTRVLPDLRREQPLAQGGSAPVLSTNVAEEGENTGDSVMIENPEVESTMVPAVMNDLFLRYEYEQIMPVTDSEQVLWGTKGGKYYHLVSDCSGMKNAVQMSRNEVNTSGKMPCPVCIAFVTPTPVPIEAQPTVSPVPEPTEEPAYRFYGTERGTYFHTDETCSGMQNAVWLSDLSGKQPCPVCIPYTTPTPMPVEATPEPTEIPDVVICDATVTPEPAPMYYGLEHSLFFHLDINCSGMENAVLLTDLTGMLPCPDCVNYISTYYGTEHGTYYHLDEHCSGMENAALLGDLSEKQPCPVCVAFATSEPTETPMDASSDVVYDVSATPEPTRAPENEGVNTIWGTEQGVFYHIAEDCSGMENAAWLSSLSGKQPCPVCIGETFWLTPEGKFFHIDPACSGMENAIECDSVEAGNSAKLPCPTCIGAVMGTGAAAGMNSIIGVNRYAVENGGIMELEYVADPEFRLIDAPDTTNWYVDEIESEEYFFGEYLDHRLSDENIALLRDAYEKDGKAGYEVRDTLVMLNGVNTEFSSDSGDVPSGKEYRFDDTKNPFRECVLYVLDRPYEGNAAEVTVVERLMQWWFDGEKVYRLTRDHTIVDESLSIVIGDGGEVIPVKETLDWSGIEVDAVGYALQGNHYAIMEYDESLALSDSELISVSGEIFKAEMTTDPTFHVNKVMGWRYPAEAADYIDVLRLSNGESSVDVPMNPEGSMSLAIAELAELLNDSGVTDAETVNNTVASLILIGENGDITAMASQPIREILRETGLTDDEIAANYMINNVIAILAGSAE